ncbi:ferredoxin [Streptomyces globisporus]|uniref:ferredoxin n=1 Tax=Streptomyces globisporus TaxID=1908 RepID=UPI0004C737EF|nr:ferredoxin [Streptomyces globisporus]
MGDRWHAEVDRSVCVGSGVCVNHAGDAFHLDSARQSRPTTEHRDAGEHVLAAAEGCPVEAITLTLAGSGEVAFPPED